MLNLTAEIILIVIAGLFAFGTGFFWQRGRDALEDGFWDGYIQGRTLGLEYGREEGWDEAMASIERHRDAVLLAGNVDEDGDEKEDSRSEWERANEAVLANLGLESWPGPNDA